MADRTCILHIGMHKTGTSSLQAALHGFTDGETSYCGFDNQNHSVAMATIFMEHPALYRVHRQFGRTREEIDLMREKFLEILEASIANTKRQLIISAESLSQQFSPLEVQNILLFFRSRFENIRIISYIRSYDDYASSSYQEYLKSGAKRLYVPKPEYERRFSGWLQAALPPEMELVKYSSDTVNDFALRVGLKGDFQTPERKNTSLTAPGASLLLLYNQNFQGSLFGSAPMVRQYNRMIESLQKVEGPKFQFSQQFIENSANEIKDDISWMEARAGFEMRHPVSTLEDSVNSIDDVYRLAREYVVKFSLLGPEARNASEVVRSALLKNGNTVREAAARNRQPSPARKINRRLFPIGNRPNVTLLNDYIIRTTIPNRASDVVFSFEAADPTIDRSNDLRKGFGEDFLLESGYGVVSILTRSQNWFRDLEIHRFFEAPALRNFLSHFDQVHSYGSSMGGFGACAFAGVLCVENVIAMQPISTLRDDLVPWEHRFPAKQRLDWTPGSAYSDAVEGLKDIKSIYVFFDPNELDSRHVDRIADSAKNLQRVAILGAKHAVPRYLSRLGFLKPMVTLALKGAPASSIMAALATSATLDEPE